MVHLKPQDLYDMGDGDNIVYDSEPLQPFDFENFFLEGDGSLPIIRWVFINYAFLLNLNFIILQNYQLTINIFTTCFCRDEDEE